MCIYMYECIFLYVIYFSIVMFTCADLFMNKFVTVNISDGKIFFSYMFYLFCLFEFLKIFCIFSSSGKWGRRSRSRRLELD